MAVLITGGAGYIGAHMVWTCIDNGEDVVVLDSLVTGFDWALPGQAKLIVGDVGDEALVRQVCADHDIDTVVHFAGSVVVPESVVDPLKYYDNNTGRTRALLSAIVAAGVKRFIFSSTAAVYAPPPTLEPVDETAPLAPSSPYGHSKLMSEQMVRDVSEAHDLSYVMLRYFNVAGADPQGRTGLSTRGATHVIKLACEAATGKRDVFEIYGADYDTPDGSAVRDFIHVSDLADAHYDALRFLRNGGKRFTGNAGYSRGASVLEVVDAVKRISGNDFPVRQAARREGDIPAIVADASRMRDRLGWRPSRDSLDQIIGDALAWEAALAKRNH
ncbi:MAG: UDP-glucose 4-epimerase GalE [Pseudomonadota bacterium]